MQVKIKWLSVAAMTGAMVISFVAGAMVLGGWFAKSGSKEIDLAAWVQAVGSLLAIGIATYIPWQQRHYQIMDTHEKENRELHRERELVQAMQVALFQPVESIRANCEVMRKFVHMPLKIRKTIPPFVFDRHPEFDQFRPSLHLMGPVGIRVNMLIAQQDLLRQALQSLRITEDDAMDKELIDSMMRRINRAEEMATEIRNNLQDSAINEAPSDAHAAAAKS